MSTATRPSARTRQDPTVIKSHRGLVVAAQVAREHPDLGIQALALIVGSRLGEGYRYKDAVRPLLREVLGNTEYARRTEVSRAAAHERMRIDMDDAIVALQTAAAEHSDPLSRNDYELWRAEGHVAAATAHTTALRFGGWAQACAAAGVDSPERPAYDTDQYLAAIRQCAADTGIERPTARAYISWHREHRDQPSLNAVRDNFGGWNAAVDQAVEASARGSQVRNTWSEGAIILYLRRYRTLRSRARARGDRFPQYHHWAKAVGGPSESAIRSLFGLVSDVPTGTAAVTVSDDLALLSIRRYFAAGNDRSVVGYMTWVKANRGVSHTVFYDRFGSWSNAVDAALIAA